MFGAGADGRPRQLSTVGRPFPYKDGGGGKGVGGGGKSRLRR